MNQFNIEDISGGSRFRLRIEGRAIRCDSLSTRETRTLTQSQADLLGAIGDEATVTGLTALAVYSESIASLTVDLLNRRLAEGEPFTLDDVENMPGGLERYLDIIWAISNPRQAARGETRAGVEESDNPNAGSTGRDSTSPSSTTTASPGKKSKSNRSRAQ